MASISTHKDGTRRLFFTDKRGERHAIHLGRMPKKQAEAIKRRVEQLIYHSVTGQPWDAELSTWVESIGESLADKFATHGLMQPRETRKLGDFLESLLEGRKAYGLKPSTILNYRQVVNDLNDRIGKERHLRDITPEVAEAFKIYYQSDRKLAATTVHRRIKLIRSIFEHGRRLKIIRENPFAEIKVRYVECSDRQAYISPDMARKIIAVAKLEWRTAIALSRFGGLRCPSEVLSLRWEDVDLVSGKMIVREPKVEALASRGRRTVPVFADLRPYLEDARKQYPANEEYVVGGKTGTVFRRASNSENGWKNANLRTTMFKLIERAGLEEWPRLFHSMRSSLETDLMQHHPIHVVAAWLGNTPKVALAHYLQTIESDFAKAIQGYPGQPTFANPTQNPTRQMAANGGSEQKPANGMPDGGEQNS